MSIGPSESTPAPHLLDLIPPRPSADLDRVLDATERCLARYGLRRTSMTDIARELGVARTTLYRQVSSMDEALALVGSREFYRFLDRLTDLLAGGLGPQAFIDGTVSVVHAILDHPVIRRVLTDEAELLGELLSSGRVTAYAEQIVDLLTPLFEAGMTAGTIRRSDPRLAADLLVRLVGGLVGFPAGDSLERVVRFALEPVLEP